jgi:hypothetical protein
MDMPLASYDLKRERMERSTGCLFVLFSFYVLHPEEVCRLHKAKETGRRPCVQATTKEIPRPQRALCANLGVWVPLTKERKKERRKEVKKKVGGGSW